MISIRRCNRGSFHVVVLSVVVLVPLSLASCSGSETGDPGAGGTTGTAGSGSGSAGITGAAGTTGGAGTTGQGGRGGSATGNAGTTGNAGSTGGAGATGSGGRGGSTGGAGTIGNAGEGGTTGVGGATGVAGTTGGGGRGGTGVAGTTGVAGDGGATGGGGRGGIGAGGRGGGGGTGGGGGFTPPTEANSIAYIGCSMADNIGGGYRAVGGTIMWTNEGYGTGAKVVQNWTANGDGWSLFNTKMNANGGRDKIKAIMVQICILSSRATDAELKSMIQAARDHTNPGTHIYIVGQPQYEAGHECNLAGTGGAKWTDDQAKALAADPSVNQNMSYLGQFKLNCSNNECQDACHANSAGQTVLGNQAKAFWGG
jgi:hypothetical protein